MPHIRLRFRVKLGGLYHVLGDPSCVLVTLGVVFYRDLPLLIPVDTIFFEHAQRFVFVIMNKVPLLEGNPATSTS
jgi:hypothetical protein